MGNYAHFGGNFEWGITRMRGFSLLFCDNGPEKPCTGDCKMYATEKQNRGSDCSLIVVSYYREQ